MKNKDLLLLSSLRANARESLTNMSRKTRIPVSTIFDRLRQHEKNIIRKHTTIVDFARLGYGARVTITLKCDRKHRDAVQQFLEKHQNVNTVYKINNGYDFLAEVVFRNIREVEEFIESLEESHKIRGKQVYYIIEDVKREDFLANPNVLEILSREQTDACQS